jgi:hypothetical protein
MGRTRRTRSGGGTKRKISDVDSSPPPEKRVTRSMGSLKHLSEADVTATLNYFEKANKDIKKQKRKIYPSREEKEEFEKNKKESEELSELMDRIKLGGKRRRKTQRRSRKH